MPPRKFRKKKPPKAGLGDVTLNDFANSEVPNTRLKKSTSNVTVAVKQEVERSWDEKDLEEFEGDVVPEENEDGTVSNVIKKIEHLGRKKYNSTSSNKNNKEDTGGIDYPFDIWLQISEYIRPEDVGIFAAICQTSYKVILSPRFWFILYRRYYKVVPKMPTFLQPEYMVRRYGLKTNVIRALYFTYQPFIDRLKRINRFEEHPESLTKSECYLLFNINKHYSFVYYFKMKRKVLGSICHYSTEIDPETPDILDDITVNPDKNCRALEVTCLHDNPAPPVLGLTLTSASLIPSAVSQYRYHKLQLGFRSGMCSSEIYAILEPVINIRILDWWHPDFPHNHNMEKLPSQNLRSDKRFYLRNYCDF